MTRIFTEGFEFGDLLFFTDPGSASVDAAAARTGSYGVISNGELNKSITGIGTLYFRQAFKITNFGGASTGNNYIVGFRNSTTVHAAISMVASDSKLHLVCVGSDVDSTDSAIITNTWYLMECYLYIADAPNGRFTLKLNGIVEIDYTGDTKSGATTTADNVYWWDNTTGQYYIDDLALNDVNGVVDNTWCGDGHVELLTPNANGDTNDWDGSDGDSTNNYLLVDDIPHDTDTTYVKTSVTEQDMYNVSDYSPTGKIVTRIYAECRAKDNNSLAGAIKVGYKHGGTVYLSSARVLSGAYARVVGDEALSDPSDSTVWSEADLDAIQFVVENSSSSSSSTSSSSSSTVIP